MEHAMPEYISVMTMSDIFDRTFKLIGKTLKRNVLIALLMTLPPIILVMAGFYFGVNTLNERLEFWMEYPPEAWEVLPLFVLPVVLLFVGILVSTVTFTWATIAIYIVVSKEMSDEPITWQEALSESSSKLLSAIGFYILYQLMLIALIMVPYSIILVGAVAENIGAVIMGVFLMIPAVCIMVWLSIKWLYGLNAVAWDDSGVIEAFKRSFYLVKGLWWRTFGIFLLLSIISQFVISIVATPVMFIGIISPYIELISMASQGGEPDSGIILSLANGMVWGYSLGIGLSVILTLLLQPVYTVVMYFDARARKGEFDDDTPDLPSDPDDGQHLGDDWQNVSV
jgi:hypothetical protein